MGNFTRWLWASLYTLYNKKNGVYLTRVQYEEDATRIIMGGPLLAQHFPSHGKKNGSPTVQDSSGKRYVLKYTSMGVHKRNFRTHLVDWNVHQDLQPSW